MKEENKCISYLDIRVHWQPDHITIEIYKKKTNKNWHNYILRINPPSGTHNSSLQVLNKQNIHVTYHRQQQQPKGG
jgi:hypothetical protein